jgi:phosphohistidine phosphatase SixA
MPESRRGVAVLVTAAVLTASACGSAARPESAPPAPAGPFLDDAGIAAALGAGGHVLLIRHTASERGTKPDVDIADPHDCDAQRALSDQGRAQARDLGRALAALGAPVGAVSASPYCRARHTAELAFGRADLVDWLVFLPAVGSDEQRARYVQRLRKALATAPADGTNAVLVTHNFNIEEATGALVSEGETVVVLPGDGGFDVVARVPLGRWRELNSP